MKAREPVFSADVEEMLGQREIEVECWTCDRTVRLTLHWMSAHRDMCCAACGTLIILNTSRLRSEVTQLRRQLGALHAQMSGLMSDVERSSHHVPRSSEAKPQLRLALAESHPDRTSSSAGTASTARRQR